jgi:hypothetical protein
MSSRLLYIARCLLLASITLVGFTAAYGQSEDVKIKNTVREVQPGLYECIIYFEISGNLSEKIDEVTYTLPYGYPERKQGGRRRRPDFNGFFSSKPIRTAEEIIVNVKIEYTDDSEVYRSYTLNPFTANSKH